MLRRAGGESVRTLNETFGNRRRLVRAGRGINGNRDDGVLPPRFLFAVHGFADAVGDAHQQVTRLDGDLVAVISAVREKSRREAARFEADHLAASDENGWYVAGVHHAQPTSGRLIGT